VDTYRLLSNKLCLPLYKAYRIEEAFKALLEKLILEGEEIPLLGIGVIKYQRIDPKKGVINNISKKPYDTPGVVKLYLDRDKIGGYHMYAKSPIFTKRGMFVSHNIDLSKAMERAWGRLDGSNWVHAKELETPDTEGDILGL